MRHGVTASCAASLAAVLLVLQGFGVRSVPWGDS